LVWTMIKCGRERIMDSVVLTWSSRQLERARGRSEGGVQCVIKRRSVPEGDRES
jgi:urease accessory protein UreE